MHTAFGQLTYCTNIHPGEQWGTHFAALRAHVPPIRAALCRDLPFGIGLRLSAEAAGQLAAGSELHHFRDWLKRSGTYVFTMNGFPYGGFHRQRVKEAVHHPDWTTGERLRYTLQLFDLLEALLPPGMEGGISTSPIGYGPEVGDRAARMEAGTRQILKVAAHLAGRAAAGGAEMHLDIEPEPDGLLDTVRDFIGWYEGMLLPMGREEGIPEAALRRHITLCFDICHVAVGFEDGEALLDELEEKGIRVGKLQISSALHLAWPEGEAARTAALQALQPFNEPTYLHQVRALQSDGSVRRWADLPPALEAGPQPGDRAWRAHFHVPLFWAGAGALGTTQEEIIRILKRQKRRPFTRHLEVETYTWEVLPAQDRRPLTESVRGELQWVVRQLNLS